MLAAVNGAIDRIVSPLAAELAPVRVNAVSPGVVDTPWWSFLPEKQRRAQFAAGAAVPVGRVGTGDDVAQAVEYLTRASLATGAIPPVDGMSVPRTSSTVCELDFDGPALVTHPWWSAQVDAEIVAADASYTTPRNLTCATSRRPAPRPSRWRGSPLLTAR